ncbi:uncharacterized protein [Oryza sativa Japonica Group]
MHLTWNPWLHFGRTLTCSPSSKSERQIAHIGLTVLSFNPVE